jgi:leucyl/phenylalanyl-tRNA---protein transferase
MFFIEPEASKVCLAYLLQHLKDKGIDWLDIQMVTPLTAQFGGEYIERSDFLKLLKNKINIL